MCPVIDNLANCKIHGVIHFLHAKSMGAGVHDQNVITEGILRQWCGMFKHG
jgi:hypothetical protein